MTNLDRAILNYREEGKHFVENKVTNFENPSVEEIKNDGWKPIYKDGKIVEWEE